MAASFMRPYRWENTSYKEYQCPVCDGEVEVDEDDILLWHFCPYCGNHLMPPEEE